MDAKFRHVIMVLYDGVENSVFESQVIAPLLLELTEDHCMEITLISFERTLPSTEAICKKIPAHDRLNLVMAQRLPFFGIVSLWPALWQLIKILKLIGGSELRARGPLAGWLVLRVVEKCLPKNIIIADEVPPVLIQARGLAAQEHRYAMQRSGKKGIKYFKDWFVQKLLNSIEADVYGYRGVVARCGKFTIESVSVALREYLIKTFKAKPVAVVIATKDITPLVPSEQVAAWRAARRGELYIPARARVYVYSGSFKPWQCAQETVTQAAAILHKERDAFFLILTTDVSAFEQAVLAAGIDAMRCRVLQVASSALTQYLAAADVGFLLREDDVINWVSRPTKMLEYQAVGLEIVHNNTVGCLAVRNL